MMKFYQRICCSLIIICSLVFIYLRYRDVQIKHRQSTSPYEFQINNARFFSSNESKCNSRYSSKELEQKKFQSVDSHIYVYSAYFDYRDSKKVVVISIIEGLVSEIHCVLWLSTNSSVTVTGSIYTIPEGSDRRYTASYIKCPVDAKIPIFVSIVRKPCDNISNIIEVKTIPKSNLTRQFAVCVTPLNLKYNKVDQLIESLSINEMLGASHIYYYNYSSGKDVQKIFDAYVKRGFITVLPWHLPMKVHVWPVPKDYVEEVKYFGQMAALNDCLYRNMGHTKYVVFADLDEFLVPRRHRNWQQLFDEIINKKYPHSRAWLFRNVFFKIEWPSDFELQKNETIAKLNAMSLLKVRRERTIYPAYERSKMIVDPLAIDVIGVHNIWNFQSGASDSVLDPDEGLCHHYRFWDGLGESTYEIDKNIHRLREDIVHILQKNRQIYL